MRFNRVLFDNLLNNLGQTFLWRRRLACPCIDPNSLAPDHNCPTCIGTGHIWQEGKEAIAAAASQRTQVNWANSGLYETGDIVLTVPQTSPMWNAGQFDRITMMKGLERFSVTMKRGTVRERLSFTPVSLEFVFWLHPTTREVVYGTLPAVKSDGSLEWGSNAPPPGTTYTLTGHRYYEYFVYQELPRTRAMHDGMRMPMQIVARRFDLLGKSSISSG